MNTNIRLITKIIVLCTIVTSTNLYGIKRKLESTRPELIAGCTQDYYRRTKPTMPAAPAGDGQLAMDQREDGDTAHSAGTHKETKETTQPRRFHNPLSLEADAEQNNSQDDEEQSRLKKARIDTEQQAERFGTPAAPEENRENHANIENIDWETKEESRCTRHVPTALTISDDDGLAPLPRPVALPTAAGAPAVPTHKPAHNPLDYPDDDDDKPSDVAPTVSRLGNNDDNAPVIAQPVPRLPELQITATTVRTLIKQIEEPLRLGYTPEAIGAAIKKSGININEMRTASYASSCCPGHDYGMNALHIAVYGSCSIVRGFLDPIRKLLIQTLLAAGAQPSVTINRRRICGKNGDYHGYDALQFAIELRMVDELIRMLFKAHKNPIPAINKMPHGMLTYLITHPYPASFIRELLDCGAITNVNRLITNEAPGYMLQNLVNEMVQYFGPRALTLTKSALVSHIKNGTPVTAICLLLWGNHPDDYYSHKIANVNNANYKVIAVLAEYGAIPDPVWDEKHADPRYQAWLRGRELWEHKQTRVAAKPILDTLTYRDLDASQPAVRILPKDVTNLITDYI